MVSFFLLLGNVSGRDFLFHSVQFPVTPGSNVIFSRATVTEEEFCYSLLRNLTYKQKKKKHVRKRRELNESRMGMGETNSFLKGRIPCLLKTVELFHMF